MRIKVFAGFITVLALCVLTACSFPSSAQEDEQSMVNDSYAMLLRALPPPVFNWAFERYVYIKIYEARQHAVNTYTYELSPYTGKIIWGCPSMGYPIPGATQLTNPDQVTDGGAMANTGQGNVAVPQPEQNGLFPPAEEAATWVSCVDAAGNITPVYDEADVRSFTVPMENNPDPNGFGIVPVPGGKPSYEIDPTIPANVDATPAEQAPPSQGN